MNVLVCSFHHHLLPLHHRLRREGHDAQAIVWHHRYEKAWDGVVEKVARRSRGELSEEALAPWREKALSGELAVLSDVHRIGERFAGAKRLYATVENLPTEPSDRVLFGGWFDGERIQAPHWLVADWGAWTGGQGPRVLGGLTLLRLDGTMPPLLEDACASIVDRLKAASFRGLFQADVEEEVETGGMRLRGLAAGWPWLHTQAFVAELRSLGAVLEGEEPVLERRIVTVLPVSVPPWPNTRAREGAVAEVRGLTSMQQASTFWFDVTIDRGARKIQTGGLDGLVAVATGAADGSLALARAKALEIAQRLELPQKQYRLDAATQVEAVLATFEERWGLVW